MYRQTELLTDRQADRVNCRGASLLKKFRIFSYDFDIEDVKHKAYLI